MVITSKSGADCPIRLPVGGAGGSGSVVGGMGVGVSVGGTTAGGCGAGVSVGVGSSLSGVVPALMDGGVGSAVPGSNAGGVACGSLSNEPSTVGSSEREAASSGVPMLIEPSDTDVAGAGVEAGCVGGIVVAGGPTSSVRSQATAPMTKAAATMSAMSRRTTTVRTACRIIVRFISATATPSPRPAPRAIDQHCCFARLRGT